MFVVVSFSFTRLVFPALVISCLTLLVLVFTLFWLYARYRRLPVIREKRDLERWSLKFRKRIKMEERNIQAAIQERAELLQAEKQERHHALEALQTKHIRNGLMSASVQEVQGIEPALKARLIDRYVCSAADITERISEVPGLAAGERQTLIEWRRGLLTLLERTQPGSLPEKQSEAIQRKYQSLLEKNKAAQHQAFASKQMLEYELISFRERLGQLASFTFLHYLSRSLASRGMVAASLLSMLVLTQTVSSVSAAASTVFSMLASLPR